MAFVLIYALLCCSVISRGSDFHLDSCWPLDTWRAYISPWSPGALASEAELVGIARMVLIFKRRKKKG